MVRDFVLMRNGRRGVNDEVFPFWNDFREVAVLKQVPSSLASELYFLLRGWKWD